MPSKSSSSKKSSPAADESAVEEVHAESAKPKKTAKSKVLSLIEDDKPKGRSKQKEGTTLPPLGATKKASAPEPKIEEPSAPAKPTLDEQKAAALNLFEEDEKPKKRVRPADTAQTSALPPISQIGRAHV